MAKGSGVDAIELGGVQIEPGQRLAVDLPVGTMITHAPVVLPVQVVRGKKPGPCLLVTACLHGDEISGAEIVRRLLVTPALKRLQGTLLAAPVVNMPAFLSRSRYLPDRRDLNRLFPGASKGSLGAKLARVITNDLLPLSDAVVDLHSGAANRPNLPQVRVTVKDRASLQLARKFDPPAILVAPAREGSFRDTCNQAGVPTVLFEGGEALRLDAATIRFGVQGILSVMRSMTMLPERRGRERRGKTPTVVCRKSSWERAPSGGLFTPLVGLGKAAGRGDTLGFVADPFGEAEIPVNASVTGVVVGRTNQGLVDEGDALFHVAVTSDPEEAEETIMESGEALPAIPDEEDDHPVHGDPFGDTV